MNPLVAAAASAGISSAAQKVTEGGFAKKAIIVILVLVVVWFGYKEYKKRKEQEQVNNDNSIVTNKNSKRGLAKVIATNIRGAFNPSGYEWLINADGTSNKNIDYAAWQIKKYQVPFDYVAQEYYNTYNDNLIVRLQKELGANQLKKWWQDTGIKPGSVKQ